MRAWCNNCVLRYQNTYELDPYIFYHHQILEVCGCIHCKYIWLLIIITQIGASLLSAISINFIMPGNVIHYIFRDSPADLQRRVAQRRRFDADRKARILGMWFSHCVSFYTILNFLHHQIQILFTNFRCKAKNRGHWQMCAWETNPW